MRLYKILLAITLNAALLMQAAVAQDGMPAKTKTELPKCNADAKKLLRSLCMFVGSSTPSNNTQHYKYMYQEKILEAACVDPMNDSDEVIAAKVSRTWEENEKKITCSGARFDLQGGNLLKFAVNSAFSEFIHDSIKWGINLNKVDEVDGRTVLDYISDKIQKNQNTTFKSTLEYYYTELRKAGAKHASEL